MITCWILFRKWVYKWPPALENLWFCRYLRHHHTWLYSVPSHALGRRYMLQSVPRQAFGNICTHQLTRGWPWGYPIRMWGWPCCAFCAKIRDTFARKFHLNMHPVCPGRISYLSKFSSLLVMAASISARYQLSLARDEGFWTRLSCWVTCTAVQYMFEDKTEYSSWNKYFMYAEGVIHFVVVELIRFDSRRL